MSRGPWARPSLEIGDALGLLENDPSAVAGRRAGGLTFVHDPRVRPVRYARTPAGALVVAHSVTLFVSVDVAATMGKRELLASIARPCRTPRMCPISCAIVAVMGGGANATACGFIDRFASTSGCSTRSGVKRGRPCDRARQRVHARRRARRVGRAGRLSQVAPGGRRRIGSPNDEFAISYRSWRASIGDSHDCRERRAQDWL